MDFLSIASIDDLATFLGVSLKQLRYFSNYYTPDDAYKSFEIKKKSGGTRIINSPCKSLKYMQKKISDELYKLYKTKKIATGFVKEKSIVTNAACHEKHNVILNIDIDNFFGSINYYRVRGVFMNKPFCFNRIIASALAGLTCCNSVLAQGSPSSPIISNYICRKMDNQLIRFCLKYKIFCTRYCDDITFSTKNLMFPEHLVRMENGSVVLGNELIDIISSNTFKINSKKTVLQTKQQRQMVTGLVINEKINIPKKNYRKFRAILHHAKYNFKETATKNGMDEKHFDSFLKGTINYYHMVLGEDNSRYQYLASKYNSIKNKEIFHVPDTIDTLIRTCLFVVDFNDGKSCNQGTAFYLKDTGLITCFHNICSLNEKNIGSVLPARLKHTTVYLADKPSQKYNVDLIVYNQYYDLLFLKIKDFKTNKGFDLAPKTINYKPSRSLYKAIGYPDTKTALMNLLRVEDMRVTMETPNCGMELKVVDKQFYAGASGGPVLDKNYKVVGYINRGNKLVGDKYEESNMSAFCPSIYIYNLLKKIQ